MTKSYSFVFVNERNTSCIAVPVWHSCSVCLKFVSLSERLELVRVFRNISVISKSVDFSA